MFLFPEDFSQLAGGDEPGEQHEGISIRTICEHISGCSVVDHMQHHVNCRIFLSRTNFMNYFIFNYNFFKAICKYDPPINATTNLPDLEYTQNFLDHTPIVCQNFPSYFSVVAVLLLIATAVLTQYPHTLKIQFMIVTIGK